MTYQQLHDMITSRFWSETLKQEIAARKFLFSPEALMAIAYKYTKSYTEKLRLLVLFAEHVPEVAEHASLVIRWLEGCFEKLKAPAPGMVFEIQFDDDGDEEHYICADFDTCLEKIDRFYEHYDWLRESEKSRYTVLKRRLLHTGDDLSSYDEGSCVIGPGKEIVYVSTGMTCEYGDCDGECEDCPHPCADNREDLIPSFIPDLSAVRYRDFADEICFGCIITDGSDGWDDYIIPLDSSMFEEGLDEYRHSLHHEHVPIPDVEQISPDALPEPMRCNYETFVAFWKQQYPDKYTD